MRPRLEQPIADMVIQLLSSESYQGLTPTKAIEKLITKEFNSLYPEEVRNCGNTEESAERSY